MIDLKAIDEVRRQHPGVVLLLHVADGYEAYRDDAAVVADTGYCTATEYEGIPLARVPEECIEKCLLTLVRAGRKIAIMDPMTERVAAMRHLPRREVVVEA